MSDSASQLAERLHLLRLPELLLHLLPLLNFPHDNSVRCFQFGRPFRYALLERHVEIRESFFGLLAVGNVR